MARKPTDPVTCPWTLLIDTAEQQPLEFVGLRCDADQQYRPLIVKTERASLGRHPQGFGDYSVRGFVGHVAVERKSIVDLQGTLLNFDGGRDRFERELFNLSGIPSLVVVEGSLDAFLSHRNDRRTREHKVVAKQLFRSVLAMMQDYKVPWFFCDASDARHQAAIVTFRFLDRFWRKREEQRKKSAKMLEGM